MPADVAVLSTSLAIIGRLVLLLGRWDAEGFPLENADARICREAGGRVRTNVLVRDLDLGVVDQFDARRLEVVVEGLPSSMERSWQWTRHLSAP